MKMEISWIGIKNFFEKHWINFRDRKEIAEKKKLFQDVNSWFPIWVTEIRVGENEDKKAIRRENHRKKSIESTCSNCQTIFRHYDEFTKKEILVCDKCIGGEFKEQKDKLQKGSKIICQVKIEPKSNLFVDNGKISKHA